MYLVLSLFCLCTGFLLIGKTIYRENGKLYVNDLKSFKQYSMIIAVGIVFLTLYIIKS